MEKKHFMQNLDGKKFLIYFFMFFIAFSSLACFKLGKQIPTVVFPNNIKVSLEVARTPQEKEKGLMYRKSLRKNSGMVFLFKPPQEVTFWMKNTYIPLDIIFLNNNIIVNIHQNTKVNQTSILYPSHYPVSEVVEVNAGFVEKHKIMIGDKVSYENLK